MEQQDRDSELGDDSPAVVNNGKDDENDSDQETIIVERVNGDAHPPSNGSGLGGVNGHPHSHIPNGLSALNHLMKFGGLDLMQFGGVPTMAGLNPMLLDMSKLAAVSNYFSGKTRAHTSSNAEENHPSDQNFEATPVNHPPMNYAGITEMMNNYLKNNFPQATTNGHAHKVDSQEASEHVQQSPGNELHDEEPSDGDSGRDETDSNEALRRATAIAEHNDVLQKLKNQVKDIKVGEEFDGVRHLGFPTFPKNMNEGFQLPAPFQFPHPATSFLPPIPPNTQQVSSGSSHSSEGSVSSQHNWSFEEQFKQVRQLYEINDDPQRKEFLDDLFSFMQKRGTPINRLPIMAKSVLDLYELFNLVIARGGLVDVINKKLWQEIIKGLHLPSSITSAAFTLRTQYMKYLYPYECERRKLSTPAELQAAIDGNRREGRRSSYGQYDGVTRDPNPQLSALSIASQQQHMARMQSMMNSNLTLQNGAHHPSHPQPLGQPMNGNPMHALVPNEFESRMVEYMKMLNKEILGNTPRVQPTSEHSPTHTPVMHPVDRMTLWNLYNSPCPPEPQREALNLSEASAPQATTLNNNNKREQDTQGSSFSSKRAKEEPSDNSGGKSSTTNMKITCKEDPRTGETTVIVTLDLMGVTYSGPLYKQPSPPNGTGSNRP